MNSPPRWRADTADRRLHLYDGEFERFSLPLDEGGRYRLIVQEISELRGIIAALDIASGVTVLPANGGLLGAATVAENFALALNAVTDPRDTIAADWEESLKLALTLCGMPAERIERIGHQQPIHLSRPERLLLGLARHLLRPPELLVLDHVFSALTRREALAVIELEKVFHDYHPFRPSLFVDLDSHGLPDVPDCRQVIRLEEMACPC